MIDDTVDNANTTGATAITYEVSDDEQPSEAVVRATAALTDTPVIDLNPLFDAIDPDHLDGLFDDPGSERAPGERSVTFAFNGYHVSVTGDEVVVRRPD